MYITVLDYENGKVIINKLPKDIDAEEWFNDNFDESNCYYMTTSELSLEVNND
jgi:hypothetical protein